MNVCIVSQEYPPETAHGGIGTQTWNKSRTLTALGHVVHVLSSMSGDGPELRSDVIDGVHVHRMRPPGRDFEVNNPETYVIGYSWLVMSHLTRLRQKVDFDIINFPEYSAEGFAFQLDRTEWNWVPIITHLHGPLAMFTERVGWPARDSEFHRVVSFMEGTSARLADGLMATSANIADFSAQYYGLDRSSIDVVHCGIDCDLFCPPTDGARRGARPTILFVGNLASNKGVMTILKAVMRLREKYPDLLLRLAGKGDKEIISTIRKTAGQDAAGNIEILGFIGERSKMPALYQSADVFASPALHEPGVANVYVEAMSCGCPVVASRTGGAPEAVTDDFNGFLVAPNDIDATAGVFDRLLSDARLRARLGNNGRQRALDYFALDKYIARVLASYQRAIERSKLKLERLKAESA